MQLPPLSVLASYPTPNYVNPETKGPALLICNCVMFSVASAIVGLRIYTRVRISRCFGADDVFILLALVWAVGIISMSAFTYAKHGGTRHVWDVEPSSVQSLLKLALATQILFGNAVTFVKISMLLLTRKIMGNGSKVLRNIILFALVFVVAGNVSYTLVMIFQCKPISAQWTLSFKPQNCINEQAHLLSASVINLVSDFLVVLIPIPVVLKLKMKARQRAIVIALFSAGFMICVVGTVRTVYGQILTIGQSSDFTWEAFPVYISGAVELYIGIICASIPPTRAFFTLYTPKFLSVTSSSDEQTSSKSRSLTSRLFGRDVEKGIPLSDLSSSDDSTAPPLVARRFSTHWEDSAKRNGNKKDGNNVQISVGRENNESVESFQSVRDRDERVKSPPQVWRGGKGPRGNEIHKVESQTNLIGKGL